jgi:hypothetical protein
LWGRLCGYDIPAVLPPEARAFLQSFECDLIDEDEVPGNWITHLADPWNDGPVRLEVSRLPDLVLH